MKNILILSLCILLIYSCKMKSTTGPEAAEAKDTAVQKVQLPMELQYGGKWEMGDMNNAVTVMEWNKRLSDNNMNVGDLLADSVSWFLNDGWEATMAKDSALSSITKMLSNYSKIEISYVAIIPVRNVDKNADWVMSWTDEKYTNKKGSVESHSLHEDYYLVNGKIRTVFQYDRKTAPPKR
jgi:hypothetical protein